MIDAYRVRGRTGPAGAAGAPRATPPTADEARAIAYDQWRRNVFAPPVCWDLDHVEAFDAVAEAVRPEDVEQSVFVSADPGAHAEHLHELAELGFDEIYLHHVGQQQERVHRGVRREGAAAARRHRAKV